MFHKVVLEVKNFATSLRCIHYLQNADRSPSIIKPLRSHGHGRVSQIERTHGRGNTYSLYGRPPHILQSRTWRRVFERRRSTDFAWCEDGEEKAADWFPSGNAARHKGHDKGRPANLRSLCWTLRRAYANLKISIGGLCATM